MNKFKSLIFCTLFSTQLTSCLLKNESPIESTSNNANLIQSGDIVVSNTGNDSIILLSSNGTYKTTLYDQPTSGTYIFNALAYDSLNNQILWTHDHTTVTLDAVNAFSLYDGTVSSVMTSSFLQGTLPGVARLTGGDLLVLENTTSAEKFTSAGVRVGNPFSAALIATTVDLNPLSTGGFIVCSTSTANTVRTYSALGVLANTATSASPTPSLGALAATSCIQDSTGRIIVAYSGTPDTVRVYTTAAMTAVAWDFVDQNVLTTPGKLALRANGNILVTDTGLDQIVEISSTGTLVQVIGGSVLSTPNAMLVVP